MKMSVRIQRIAVLMIGDEKTVEIRQEFVASKVGDNFELLHIGI
jgi:hypothetical protein